MRAIIAAVALAACTAAYAGPVRVVLQNPAVFWSYDDASPRALTITKDGERKLSILDTGDVMFEYGATINTNAVLPVAGHCIGYMVVRINGEPMLVAVHAFRPGHTPPAQFDRGDIPRGTYTPRDCRTSGAQ